MSFKALDTKNIFSINLSNEWMPNTQSEYVKCVPVIDSLKLNTLKYWNNLNSHGIPSKLI